MSTPEYIFNLHFWNPHNLQLKNFIVPNEKLCPVEMKMGILQEKSMTFLVHVHIFMSSKIAFILTVGSSF